MRPIAPRLPDDVAEEITVAEDQHEYMTITAARVRHTDGTHSMYCRWTLTPEERRRVAAGEDIYLAFPERVAPHSVSLRPEWATPHLEGQTDA